MDEKKKIYLRMNQGYRDLSNEPGSKPVRTLLALEAYAQETIEHFRKYALDNGILYEQIRYLNRKINIICLSVPESLANRVLEMNDQERTLFFPHLEAVHSEKEMNLPVFKIE